MPGGGHRAGPGPGREQRRYTQTYRLKGLNGYLAAEQPGCWGLLTSIQLAGLCPELNQTRYTDCRAIGD